MSDEIVNYYNFFDLPVKYDIDEGALQDAYMKAQYACNLDEECDDSSCINRAYETLKNPIARGEYFLKLHGEDPEKMCGNAACDMFDMQNEYYSLKTDQERKMFQKKLLDQKEKMLNDLKTVTEKVKFLDIFTRARFIDSFLKKVRSDVYNRD